VLCSTIHNEWVFTGSADTTIQRWKLAQGGTKADDTDITSQNFGGHAGPVTFLTVLPVAAKGKKKKDGKKGTDGKGSKVGDASGGKQQYQLVSGSVDSHLRLWDMETGRCVDKHFVRC
jgi:hypothetical protein